MTNCLKDYIKNLRAATERIDTVRIRQLIDLIKKAKRIYIYGNGGSGATASHFAGDMRKSLGLRTFCLNDNNTALTAWANDDDYEKIFLLQLYDLYEEGDLCIALSGSGKSPNIVATMQYDPFVICGFDAGDFRDYKNKIHIPINDMEIFEDISLVICHMIKRELMEG